MDIKVIKTQNDYKEALETIKKMMGANLTQDSAEAEKLELLITLVQDYESKMFPDNIPDPIDAILFRMDQLKLTQADLIPYIGSKSKVSEVLARKRPLSLNMIKSLHDGLGIPAEVLLNQVKTNRIDEFDYKKFPLVEMVKRGYINKKNVIEQEIKAFFGSMMIDRNIPALLSRTYYIRSPRPMNQYALFAWMAQVVNKSKKNKLNTVFDKKKLTVDVLKRIVDLTDELNAFYKVRNLLNSLGISLVVEPHMPQTYLDGAAIMINPNNPIIGITVRNDRLDNFWFTLLHELAHIYLHYGTSTNLFYDDVESVDLNDPREKETDELALNIMIPEEKWKNSAASIVPSPDAAKLLATELSIHPSIVAGRMRYSRKQYHLLNSLIGNGEVRKLFPEADWRKKS